MKKIIILGSSGFVGKSLNDFLNKKKYKIINISRSEKKDIFKIKTLPVSDYIIYCINCNNIKKSLNIFNHFKNLIKKQKKNLKILFFSSGAVYGPKHKNNKFKETEKIKLNQIEKYTDYKKKYAKEKFFLEKEFLKLSNEGYKVSIVRGFTFYGKHILDYSYLISKIILAVKSKKEMKIDNPNTVRSYMHADDMCNWLIKILNNPQKNVS